MATMEDVAKAAKVSRATVSRVLSNYPSIKPETRSNVMYWVDKLNYSPNQVAQNLAGTKTNLIGVLFSDLSNPLYAALATAIIREAEKEGFSVILGDAQREKAREVNIINNFRRRQVDGIIVRPIGEPNRKFYDSLSLPVVGLYKMTGKKNIIISSEEGSAQVARHFYSTGHVKMGYLGPIHSQAGNDKLGGFRAGAAEYGLELQAVLECNQHETAENQKAYEIIQSYLSLHDPREVTAWFAHSDIAASDIVRALIQHGVRVPEEVVVCGYNDTLLSRKMIPSLSSVASPLDEIARNAIALFLRALRQEDGEETLFLSPSLMVRESSMAKLNKTQA
ncbi:MAG: LacI family DNA-binding transcriptional regulator [Gemmiger sp.]